MPSDAATLPDGLFPADIDAAVTRVLHAAPLSRSGQLQRLLRYLVAETLAGRGTRLKEYVIGVEVFGRPASYDPRLDSLVRVEAKRLRAALETYYQQDGAADPLIIHLDKGTYVPAFSPRTAAIAQPIDLAAATLPPASDPTAEALLPATSTSPRARFARMATVALLLLAVAAVVAGLYFRSKQAQALSDRDSIVITRFANSTGEAIFDDTLKQGLTSALEQSPFLNIVSERRTAQVLGLMGRTPAGLANAEVVRELCLRAGGQAMVSGSIDRLGSQYVIGLTATSCATGDSLAHVQAQTDRKESVLGVLGRAATDIRARLGESAGSIKRFEIPIEDVTTASLDALQAYSLGRKIGREKGSPADVPFYQRAVELDHNFAVAHAALGVAYVNLGQPSLAAASLQRAFDLRDGVSEREKYRISAYYHQVVTGDLEKASAVYELWKRTYPRDVAASINLGLCHLWLGDYDRAAAETKDALRVEPANVVACTNLAALFIKLGRTADAEATLDEAQRRGLSGKLLRSNLCYVAFLKGDDATIERQLADVGDKPSESDALLSLAADSEAYRGRLARARDLSRRAVEAATRAGAQEAAAGWLVNAALREAECGDRAVARAEADEALRLTPGRDVTALAALAQARAGGGETARMLLARLESDHPSNTVIHAYWAPTIRAAIEIRAGRADAALDALKAVAPHELGSPPPIGLATLYPVYLRGEALLLKGAGIQAAAEFQRILDHPGLVLNCSLGALARLQLARARSAMSDYDGARAALDSFLTLWKDADAHLPVLDGALADRRRLDSARNR